MRVLIVESQPELGKLWQRHLTRQGGSADLATDQNAAIQSLCSHSYDLIVLDLVLADGSALAVADFASYRHPRTRVLFVTNTSFFSDGSIFSYSPNACGYVQSATPPEDLAAIVEHHASAR